MSDDEATANNESRPAVGAPVQPSVRPHEKPLPGGLRLTVTERCELYDWRDACVAGETERLRELADSEGTRAVEYLRRARRAEESLRLVAPILDGFVGPPPTPDQWTRICALAEVVRAGLRPNAKLTGPSAGHGGTDEH